MRIVDSWFWGIFKRKKLVTISRDLRWIEIEEITTFFKWTIREDFREVYLPNLKEVKQENLRVIAEAYTELHEVARKLQEEVGQ